MFATARSSILPARCGAPRRKALLGAPHRAPPLRVNWCMVRCTPAPGAHRRRGSAVHDLEILHSLKGPGRSTAARELRAALDAARQTGQAPGPGGADERQTWARSAAAGGVGSPVRLPGPEPSTTAVMRSADRFLALARDLACLESVGELRLPRLSRSQMGKLWWARQRSMGGTHACRASQVGRCSSSAEDDQEKRESRLLGDVCVGTGGYGYPLPAFTEVVITAVGTAAVLPFMQALATQAGNSAFDAARRTVARWVRDPGSGTPPVVDEGERLRVTDEGDGRLSFEVPAGFLMRLWKH